MPDPLFEAKDPKTFESLLKAKLAEPNGATKVASLRHEESAHTLATAIAEEGNLAMMKLLVNAQVNLGERGPGGESPLHFAVGRGDQSMVKLLLKCQGLGIEVNAQDDWGVTALHRAAEKGDVRMVDSLIQGGGSPDLPDKRGNLASHYAARAGRHEVIDLLHLVASSTLVATNHDIDTPAHRAAAADHANVIARLAKHKGLPSVTQVDKDGAQPLHVAALSGNVQAVKALLEAGVPRDTPCRTGPESDVTTALMLVQMWRRDVLEVRDPQNLCETAEEKVAKLDAVVRELVGPGAKEVPQYREARFVDHSKPATAPSPGQQAARALSMS